MYNVIGHNDVYPCRKKNYMTCVYKSSTVHDIKQQRKQKELFMLLVSILVPV